MATGWKNVHVFISSTFNDMHAERDYLVKRVFPQLREWCEKRKLRLIDIDLRWGVTEEDATRNRNVVRTCLERIDYCRPFFVCFLGQRRGWVPEAKHIAQETLHSFPELARYVGSASVTEMEIFHALIQPLHGQKRYAEGKGEEFYQRVEHAFFYLRENSYLADLPPMLRATYTNESSDDPGRDDRELSHWRDDVIPSETAKWNRPLHRYRATWMSKASTPELAMPLQCPSTAPENQARWRRTWREEGVQVDEGDLEVPLGEKPKARAVNKALTSGRLTDLKAETGEELAEVLIRELQQAIAQRHPDHQPVQQEDPLQKELDQQEEFLYTNSEGFIERAGDFDELDAYLTDESRQMFVLTAPGGMGKSMLLANCVARQREKAFNADTAFVFRFIGQSDASSTVASLLRSAMLELQRVHKRIPETRQEKAEKPTGVEETRQVPFEIPQDPTEVHNTWREQLQELGKRGKTVIVIDAVNQLESGLDNLYWLPLGGLPENVKFIVSFREGASGSEECLQQWAKISSIRLSHVKPFEDLEERRKLVKAYLSQFLKELDQDHLEALICSDGAANPLFLKVVLSELRVLGAFTQLGDVIRDRFGDTPVSAFEAVLRRLETDPAYSAIAPTQTAPLIFGLLAHARRGLSINELTDLLVGNADTIALPRSEVQDAVHLFLRQVRPFLARRSGLHSFFFESFEAAVTKCYAKEPDPTMPMVRPAEVWHGLIADYFDAQPEYLNVAQCRKPNARRCDELPWQLLSAGRKEQLEQLLTSFPFVKCKTKAFGPPSLVEDCQGATKVGCHDLLPIARVLTQAGHVLSSKRIVSTYSANGALAIQMLGRLAPGRSHALQKFLDQARMELRNIPFSLEPLTASMATPCLMYRIATTNPEVLSILTLDNERVVLGSRSPLSPRGVIPSLLGELHIYRLSDGQLMGRGSVSIAPARIHAGPDGHHLVVLGDGYEGCLRLCIFDTRSFTEVDTPLSQRIIKACAHLNDGRAIALSEDGKLIVFVPSTGEIIREFSVKEGFSPRNEHVPVEIAAFNNGSVITHDGDCLSIWDITNAQLSIAIPCQSPLTVASDGTAILPETRSLIPVLGNRFGERILGIFRALYTGTEPSLLKLLKTESEDLRDVRKWITSSTVWDIWNLVDGKRKGSIRFGSSTGVQSGVSPAGLFVLLSSCGGKVLLLDPSVSGDARMFSHGDETAKYRSVSVPGCNYVAFAREHVVTSWLGDTHVRAWPTSATGATIAIEGSWPVGATSDGIVITGNKGRQELPSVWDLNAAPVEQGVARHFHKICGFAVDGSERLISADISGIIKVSSLDTGSLFFERSIRPPTAMPNESSVDRPPGGLIPLTANGMAVLRMGRSYMVIPLTDAPVHTLPEPLSSMEDPHRFVPIGNTIALFEQYGNHRKRLLLWDVEQATARSELLHESVRGGRAVGDETLLVWYIDNSFELRNCKTGESRALSAHQVHTFLASRFFASESDNVILLYTEDVSQRLSQAFSGARRRVYSWLEQPGETEVSIWRHNGKALAVPGSWATEVCTWTCDTGVPARGGVGQEPHARVTLGSACCVLRQRGASIEVWNTDYSVVWATYTCDAQITCCTLAPGPTVVIGDESGRVHLLRLNAIFH